MKMTAQFPVDAPQILSEIGIVNGVDETVLGLSSNAIITFTIHTPEGDFMYTIDNAAKTLTTESDKPFIA